MRGLYLDGAGVPVVRDDLPEPQSDESVALIRVTSAGICATDLALARGYMGFSGVPGHEFVGVAETGPLAGERVVGEINAACGTCARCRTGLGRHCEERTVLGIWKRAGAFAERLALPNTNLHRVPDRLSDEAATFTEPVAAAFEIVEQLAPARGTRTLVAGDGRLGILCAWVLALHGLDVTVAGRHPERSDLLPDGVELRTGALEAEAAPKREFELAVDATGDPNVLSRLLGTVEPRGTIVLKTTSERPAHIDLAPLVVDEITLVGSRCGPFAPALEALADGAIPVERLVEARYPLAEGPRAFERAARRGTLKVLLDVAP